MTTLKKKIEEEKSKKKSPKKYLARFEEKEWDDLIEAASREGLSVNAMIRIACRDSAEKILKKKG